MKSDLEPLLPDADIQHVGSTAIPGSLTRGDRVPAVGILTVIDGICDIQWRFRDLLAASESLRSEYDDLKRQLEGKSMAKYREAKEKFVTRVLDGR